jgi:ABC-type transport system substrate-binding protein
MVKKYKINGNKLKEGANEILKEAINRLEKITEEGLNTFLTNEPRSIESTKRFSNYLNEQFNGVYMKAQSAVQELTEIKNFYDEAQEICLNKLID